MPATSPTEWTDDFSVTVEREGRLAVVHTKGEMDAETCPRWREVVDELVQAGDVWLVLDLLAVTFFLEVALGEAFRAKKLTEAGGGCISVVPGPKVARVLELSGSQEALNARGSVDEARALLQAKRSASEGHLKANGDQWGLR